MAPDNRKRAELSNLLKFTAINAFLLTGSAFRWNTLQKRLFVSVTEVQSVNPSNQAVSDVIGTALSPNNGSLCSGSWVVAVDNEIVSGSIADSHPQLAERKGKPQLANQKR